MFTELVITTGPLSLSLNVIGYNTTNVINIAGGVETDIVKKKDPSDLDFTHVAEPGVLMPYEDAPPEYEEVSLKPKAMETYDTLPTRDIDPVVQNSTNDAFNN